MRAGALLAQARATAAILGEELELPRIQPRGRRSIPVEKLKYSNIRRVGPESLRHFKRTFREALKRHPRRLRASAIVGTDAAPSLLRGLRDDGFIGVRFQFRDRAEPPDLAAPEYRGLLGRIADLGWHVHLHDHGARLPAAIAAIEPFGVNLIVEHFGRPTQALGVNCPGFRAVLAAVERGRTWVKLSAGFRLEPPDAPLRYARKLLEVAGGERLMWGSDWPFAAFEDKVKYADTIAAFHEWMPDPATREKIGSETPLKLYFS